MAAMRWRDKDGHIYEYMGDEGSGHSSGIIGRIPSYASSGPEDPMIMTEEGWHKLSTHIPSAKEIQDECDSLWRSTSLEDGAWVSTSTSSTITGDKTFVGEYEGKSVRLVANDDGSLSWEIYDEEGDPIKIDISSGVDLAKELDDLKKVREDGTWSAWEESRRKRSDLYSELDEARKLAQAGERRWKVALANMGEKERFRKNALEHRHPRTSEEFND